MGGHSRPGAKGAFDPSLELLLAHDAWVRRLARRMSHDTERADDLAQDTWLSALHATWTRRGSARSFLAGILRRRALHEQRSWGRRREHESKAEPQRDEPSVDEALERAETGRELTRLMIELEEPFRSVVLLKIQTELPASAMAKRLGIPTKTVESRLARGIARLRERWLRLHPEDHGRARACLALLGGLPRSGAPPLLPATGAVAPTLGAWIVNTKLVLGSLLLTSGGGALALAYYLSGPAASARSESAVEQRSAVTGELEPPTALPAPERAAREAHARAALAAAPPGERGVAEDDAALRTFRGRVVDPEGRSIPGVPVIFRGRGGSDASAVTDARGRFELVAKREPGRVSTSALEYEDLFSLSVRATDASTGGLGGDDELLLVTARHRPLSGRVVDEFGAPMRGATVGLELPEGFLSRFDAVLDAADDRTWRVETDEDGAFELERAPVVLEARLTAKRDGYVDASLLPPLGPGHWLELVLRRPEASEDTLEGRVLDAAGAPVAGALVSLGGLCATTAADGTFRLGREDGDETGGTADAFDLVAVKKGYLPGRARALSDAETGDPLWPDWIEVVLGGEPLELAGRIVDERGEPLAGLRVWLDDPTRFGIVGDDLTVQLENLVAPIGSTYEDSSDDYFRWTSTDDDGRFRVQGLVERAYTLGVLDPKGAATSRHGPFAAGRADLSIELARPEPRRVVGRLISDGGAQLEGAQVVLHAPMFGGVHHASDQVTTDAEGRFAFDGVTGADLTLWIRGQYVVPAVERVDWDGDEVGEIVVEALCHLKVDLGACPELADAIQVLDADGQPLVLRDIGAGGYRSRDSWELIDGRSVALGVSERARELVLRKDYVEVRRIPLSLAPGRLEIVTP